MLELMAIIAIVVNSALIGMSGQVHRWFPNYSGAQIFLIIVILEVSHTPPQIYQVLLRPPSGHHPGRRQSRHARILQIGLRLAVAQADARPVMSIFFKPASVWPSPRQTPGPSCPYPSDRPPSVHRPGRR